MDLGHSGCSKEWKSLESPFLMWPRTLCLYSATLPKLMAIPKLAFNAGPTSPLDRPFTFLICLHYLLQLVLGPRSQNFDDDTLFGSYALWIKISVYWRGTICILLLSRGTRQAPRKNSLPRSAGRSLLEDVISGGDTCICLQWWLLWASDVMGTVSQLAPP